MSTPEDAAASSVFANNDVLIASNDGGQYFAPNFGVDQIGEWAATDGYSLFPSGANNSNKPTLLVLLSFESTGKRGGEEQYTNLVVTSACALFPSQFP